MCVFDNTDERAFFNKWNYKVAITIEPNSSRMRPVNRVKDTCVGASLLHKNIVEPDWMSSIRVREKTAVTKFDKTEH